MHPPIERAAVLLACALVLPAAAGAQIVPVSRSSHLVGSRTDTDPDEHIDQSYTAWESGTHSGPAVSETLTLTPGSITVQASGDGWSYYNQMQHYGWTRIGSCTTDVVFDLLTPGAYMVSGQFHGNVGGVCNVTLTRLPGFEILFDTPDAQHNGPVSAAGELSPGRYWLHVDVIGYGMEGGGGSASATVTLTVTPAPGAAAVAGLACTWMLPARRRRP